MKIKVQLLVANRDGIKENGRICWINKNQQGQLTISNIYTDEKTASNLNQDDLDYIQKNEYIGAYKVIEII